jgi:hypothetical protein
MAEPLPDWLKEIAEPGETAAQFIDRAYFETDAVMPRARVCRRCGSYVRADRTVDHWNALHGRRL